MANSLEVLAENRDALLLAEVAAWLHMFGKFHEKFLEGNHDLAIKIPDDIQNDFPKLYNMLTSIWPSNIWSKFPVAELQSSALSIFHFIETHQNIRDCTDGLLKLMADAHGRGSSTEKGVLVRFAPEQRVNVYLSTSLGYEADSNINLQKIYDERQELYKFLETQLYHLEQSNATLGYDGWMQFLSGLVHQLEHLFSHTVAESRKPLNDVTLFDQTMASVAFFKAALAQNLLEGWKEPNVDDIKQKYRWRLLRVGIDGLTFWGTSTRIADVIARKNLIKKALDQVKELLEVIYPLGIEVYRDENGSVFIVPDIGNLPSYLIDTKSLEEQIQQIAYVTFSGEAVLTIILSEDTRNTLSFGRQATLALPFPHPDAKWLIQQWQGDKRDVCPVCGLRPQGPSSKAISRKVCDVCESRRLNSSQIWSSKRYNTIWFDEVSDLNGNLALITAQFGFADWIAGVAYNTVLSFDPSHHSLSDARRNNIKYDFDLNELMNNIRRGLEYKNTPPAFIGQTLLDKLVLRDNRDRLSNTVRAFYNVRIADTELETASSLTETERLALEMLRLSPSFSRISRTWRITQSFWQQIVLCFKEKLEKSCKRLRIQGVFKQEGNNKYTLGISHSYDLKLSNTNLSIACLTSEDYITVDNLCRTARLLGASKEIYENEDKSAAYIQGYLKNKQFPVEEPTGYAGPNEVHGILRGTLQIIDVRVDETLYIPAIPILTEPRTFMALVPADKALAVIDVIKKKYETEMGKVRNRLPLTIGVVFAGSRTPLPAILDAGRRMLKQPIASEVWKVEDKVEVFDKSTCPDHILLTLKQGERIIEVKVPATMGDKKTEDVWYPYWCLEKGTSKAVERKRVFKGIDRKTWVHVSDLHPCDEVAFMPSRFDFELLDTAARRFEVSYKDGRRREETRSARPYCLEQLKDFKELWDILSEGLYTSQIDTLVSLIEGKRREWKLDRGQENPTFTQIVSDIINNANWQEGRHPKRIGKEDFLCNAAVNGQLADVADLYMHILKQKTKVDLKGEKQ
jgi:CRISPR-associated Csx11 family protein